MAPQAYISQSRSVDLIIEDTSLIIGDGHIECACRVACLVRKFGTNPPATAQPIRAIFGVGESMTIGTDNSSKKENAYPGGKPSASSKKLPISSTYIRSVSIWGFEDIVERFGGNAQELLVEAGLPADLPRRQDTLISFERYVYLAELSAVRLNCPSFALEWSASLPPEMPVFDSLMLLSSLCRTGREWAELGMRYWALHCDGLRIEFVDTNNADEMAVRSFVDPLILFPVRQLVEGALANQVKMARSVGDREQENPVLVRFQHREPKDTSVHERIFRCPLQFDAPHNEIVFDKKYAEMPIGGRFAALRPLANYYVKTRLQRMPLRNHRIADAAVQAIQTVIGTGNCNSEFVANVLGLHTKKLQRLLAEENTTFADVLDQTRHAMARRYLTDSSAPISKIANLLDYAGQPQFNLAFRRWTGTTPLAFRKAAR
jgi:AraC-like DNA-binding protein